MRCDEAALLLEDGQSSMQHILRAPDVTFMDVITNIMKQRMDTMEDISLNVR